MADELIINGVASEGNSQTENDITNVSDMFRKMEALEHEKLQAMGEETGGRVRELRAVIERLRSDEAEVKARAVELEIEVARLQEHLASMSEGDVEVKELKKVMIKMVVSDGGVKEWKLQWPAVAVTGTIVAAAAVLGYLHYARRRT